MTVLPYDSPTNTAFEAESPYERSVAAYRADGKMQEFVKRNYLDEDLAAAVSRYAASPEFGRICSILRRYLSPNCRIADLGSGRGLTSLALAQAGARVTSIEFDPSNVVGIGAMAGHLRNHQASVQAIRGDVLRMPFDSGTFDAVFCRSVLHHVDDLAQALVEIRRVLKPGGIFLACNEHILSLFSDGKTFLSSHPAVRYGVDEHAYPALSYWWSFRRAGFRGIRIFGAALEYEDFLQVTMRNPVRYRLCKVPVVGPSFARFFYGVHRILRIYVRVHEELLPAISVIASKI